MRKIALVSVFRLAIIIFRFSVYSTYLTELYSSSARPRLKLLQRDTFLVDPFVASACGGMSPFRSFASLNDRRWR